MKSKALILIGISAIITLSFTFASVKKDDQKVKSTVSASVKDAEPIGGFAFDDK